MQIVFFAMMIIAASAALKLVIQGIQERQSKQISASDCWIDITGGRRSFVKLTDEEAAEVKQLKLDEKEIDRYIAACRRNLATSTREDDIKYYQARIEGLKSNLQTVRMQYLAIEHGKNRPKLHRHSNLIPVESGNDVVAWICGGCDKQLDETDPTVKQWIEDGVRRAQKIAEKAEADRKWSEL